MGNKINISQLLKDCPQGMELYSPIFGTVYFEGIRDTGRAIMIDVTTSCNTSVQFYSDGKFNTYYSESEVTLFPSKSQRDWSKFQRPFRDGDIVFYNDTIAIFKEWGDETLFKTYVTKYLCCDSLIDTNVPLFGKGVRREIRFATEKEKEILFQAIKDNGYKWNPETKDLEELIESKFKVGDKIKHKTHISRGDVVIEIKDTHYILDDELALPFVFQDEYELVPNKFDITTLKAFESRVLVRDYDSQIWIPKFWGKYLEDASNCRYLTTNGCYKYCIPYEDNEHLLGIANDCDEYYKTWE